MEKELAAYLEAIKRDYLGWQFPVENATEAFDIKTKMVAKFNAELRVEEGQKYLKVISGSGVHSFIVKEDGEKFKRGDILKAASWSAPAKNRARGNIFGQYRIRWTGAEYLR